MLKKIDMTLEDEIA